MINVLGVMMGSNVNVYKSSGLHTQRVHSPYNLCWETEVAAVWFSLVVVKSNLLFFFDKLDRYQMDENHLSKELELVDSKTLRHLSDHTPWLRVTEYKQNITEMKAVSLGVLLESLYQWSSSCLSFLLTLFYDQLTRVYESRVSGVHLKPYFTSH